LFVGFNYNFVLIISSFLIDWDLLAEVIREVISGKRALGRDIAFLRLISTKSWGYCICFWEVNTYFSFMILSVYWKLFIIVFLLLNLLLILFVLGTNLEVSLGLYRDWSVPSLFLIKTGSLTLIYFVVNTLAG
jgi:hypothetical protein